MTLKKLMKAVDYDRDKLVFPMVMSPKIDGIRVSVQGGKLISNSLKLIPNMHIQELFRGNGLEGLDGEMTIGDVTDFNVMQKSMSGIMSVAKIPAGLTYTVFDVMNEPEFVYRDRMHLLSKRVKQLQSEYPFIKMVEQRLGYTIEDIDTYAAYCAHRGYEGIMLNSLDTLYKHGRGTIKQRQLFKVKAFTDSEAEVLEVLEAYQNNNEAVINEMGNTSRSSHQENKTPKGTMGALRLRDIHTGIEFKLGTGFTDEQRLDIWNNGIPKDHYVKYKHFPYGVVDKPRLPSFLGYRHHKDVS